MDNPTTVKEDIEQIVRSLQIYRFTTELNNIKILESTEINDERIIRIETILNTLTGKSNGVHINRKEFFSSVDSAVYKYPWRKLPEFHKNVKLKEYISEKYGDNINELEKLLLSNSELNSDKCVTYNQENAKIDDIPVLKYDDLSKKYKIEITKPKAKPKPKVIPNDTKIVVKSKIIKS